MLTDYTIERIYPINDPEATFPAFRAYAATEAAQRGFTVDDTSVEARLEDSNGNLTHAFTHARFTVVGRPIGTPAPDQVFIVGGPLPPSVVHHISGKTHDASHPLAEIQQEA